MIYILFFIVVNTNFLLLDYFNDLFLILTGERLIWDNIKRYKKYFVSESADVYALIYASIVSKFSEY